VLKLVENWTEWALFPPRFTKGLEAVMCSKSENTETASTLVQQAQQQWQSTTDVATLERGCRQRGLSVKGGRQQLLHRLCLFEAYWPPDDTLQSPEPKMVKDLGVDGKVEAGLDGEFCDCGVEEPRPLGLRVVLLPEWQSGSSSSKEPIHTQQAPQPKKAKKEPREQAKEDATKSMDKVQSSEVTRRERLRQVEAEVERYRQQLEKACEQPEVLQMKCDRRRMELLEAAAHQESWSERTHESAESGGDTVSTGGPEEAAQAMEDKPREDAKSGKEKEEVTVRALPKDAKDSKKEDRSKVKQKVQEKEKDKDKDKDKDREKDKEKGKEMEKERNKEKDGEKDKEREKEKVADKEKEKEKGKEGKDKTEKTKDKESKEKEKEKERDKKAKDEKDKDKDKGRAKDEKEKERRKRSRDRDRSSSQRKRKASPGRAQKKRWPCICVVRQLHLCCTQARSGSNQGMTRFTSTQMGKPRHFQKTHLMDTLPTTASRRMEGARDRREQPFQRNCFSDDKGKSWLEASCRG
ncbi:Nipped-B-like protein B, partial [Durusdinium trenchii]